MTVNFYKTFSKRKNSTKQPAAADTYDAIDCKLKEDCSIENPSFIISQRTASASGNPVTVNAQKGDMINPIVTFNPIQSGSGTPSPSNPRPIQGYGDLQVTVNGIPTYINIGGTKYGGALEVSTGVLTVNWIEIDLGDYNYAYADFGTNSYFIATIPTSSYTAPLCLSDIYNYTNALGSTDTSGNYVIRIVNNNNLRIRNLDYTNPAVFKTAMRGHKAYIDIGTNALQIQLTPAQIALVQGSNVVAVNGNSSIAFSYKKDKIDLTYTYVQVPDFNRYYFVSNVIILSNNRVEYVCECDALASFKSNIGSTVARIAFSTTGWDKDIIDPRMGVETTKLKYQRSDRYKSGA